jgi:signal transduction histidine kinase
MNDDIQIYKKLLEIRTEELLKYRNFTFSAISKAYMSNKSDKEFREWFKDESARILPSSIGGR